MKIARRHKKPLVFYPSLGEQAIRAIPALHNERAWKGTDIPERLLVPDLLSFPEEVLDS